MSAQIEVRVDGLCAKGCGQPARVRGMCRSHYATQRKYSHNLQRWSRQNSIGSCRRIRALVALGYTQQILSKESGLDPSWISKLAMNNRRQRVNADTAMRVNELYDRLSMTPGPSEAARNRAHRKGWMPPLAWDDDTIDSPEAQPNPGHEEKIGFVEKFLEMRELDYSDLVIAQRWKIQPASLLRQLHRYEIEADPELVNVAASAKHRSRVKAVS